MKTLSLKLERWASPLNELWLATDEDGALRALEFADGETRLHRLLRDHYGVYELNPGAAPKEVTQALGEYFAGDLTALDAVKVATGGTAFQREVWDALRKIPAGTTVSYGELAAKLGRASASRAVGAANGANPVSIVVPCHRVIGANGALTGYGGGLPRKKWLLEHEGGLVCA